MQIMTRFALGETVWTIYRTSEAVSLPCSFCRGQKRLRVEVREGASAYVDCPECRGRGEARLSTVPKWKSYPRPLTIGLVAVRVCSDESYNEERYMCVETGVGSGTLHDVGKLFATAQDAATTAERLNEEIIEGKGWKPDQYEVERARGFLDHRDVYEHEPEHVDLAKQIIAASEYEPLPAEVG